MAGDVLGRVIWPTQRKPGADGTPGRPLAVDEIEKAVVQMAKLDDPEWYGSNRDVLPDGDEPAAEFTQQALEAGPWWFRCRVIDKAGVVGDWSAGFRVDIGGELAPPGVATIELQPL